MFIFKLLQGVLKQWQEHGSSNTVLWAASPRVLASLSTRGQCLARAQALTLLDGQFCTMTFPATLVPWLYGDTMGSSPVSIAEPPAQRTCLWRTDKHLFTEEASHRSGPLFLKDAT